jgi:hypothetical protein
VTFLGGSEMDEERHQEYREEPVWAKYALWPFAVAAAPFKAAAEALRDDEDSGPPLPQPEAASPRTAPAPPRTDYETARLQSLERELDERLAREGPADPVPPTPSAVHSAQRPLSIAEELAALRRTPAPPPPRAPEAAPVRESRIEPDHQTRQLDPGPIAHGIVDRNGDGRVDHWIFRERGEIVRESFDEDFDGAVDRTLHYDLATHQVRRVEEDSDHDGAIDSWTDYRDGAPARRRADGDRDGLVDTWSFYRDGEVARLERDTTGDGFRDRVSFYAEGRLRREEQDLNGDGHPDVTTHYDAEERVGRREEDRDGDGRVDVISHYDSGRLTRRELIDPEAALDLDGSSERRLR